ncbi:MAG: enoyl-CoA hydratase/isomerase family protein [Dehalococcoidia bacterium]|nr:MAG: enoyl-CoA hydratase/isomerase family protein [Dehalococcoidia bacterium]
MLIKYEKRGHVGIFTINRPEVMNALNAKAYKELRRRLNSFRDDPELWVGILTGAGDKAFSTGYDLKDTDDWHEDDDWCSGLEMWKPVVAAINGYCLGWGFELILSCDIRIAAEHAQFGLPEVKRGQIPGGGGTQLLTRMVPYCHAAEIILTGRYISAEEAYHIGLINRVVSSEKLLSIAMEIANMICQNAPLAVQAAKESMVRGLSTSLEEGMELERAMSFQLTETEDYKEGERAFIEHREPNWKAK